MADVSADIDALITDRIANLQKAIRTYQAQAAANIAMCESKIAALDKIKGNITERDVVLYRLLKDEGILQELTR